MLRETLIQLSQQRRLQDFAMHNRLAQSMARRFVAGETLPDAVGVVRDLNSRGLTATLDHLGENVTSPGEAEMAATAAVTMFHAIATGDIACNVSLKLTQLGLDISEDLALENLSKVIGAATETNNFLRIDMEGSAYVDRTLSVLYRARERHPNVGAVIQSYLDRSAMDLEHLIEARVRVRLVKGAYLEPPGVAFQRKSEVDHNFIVLMRSLLDRGVYPAIATHDPAMIEATIEHARDHRLSPDGFEFQMLYGIRRDLQERLRAQGYRVRIYVPYGTQWYPYLMRRMAERPANVMFVLGNLMREAFPRFH